MSDNPLDHVFTLFIKVMPQDELITYEEFKKKLEEKEHDETFRTKVKDFTTHNHEHDAMCTMSNLCTCSDEHLHCLARDIFRELLK